MPPAKSVKLLAVQVNAAERTMYRYFDLVKELGFELQKDAHNRWYIEGSADYNLDKFTNEETEFIRNLVLQYGGTSIFCDSILIKTAHDSETNQLSRQLVNAHLSTLISTVQDAILQEKQLILKNYHSLHSNTISNRLVEPIAFTSDFQYLCAFEVSTLKNKYFATRRILSIELTPTKHEYTCKHQIEAVDAFGFSFQGKTYTIHLNLKLRAYMMLKEEYPPTIPYISIENNQYILHIKVNNLKPIGRFVKGLIDDVEIIGDQQFLDYIKKDNII
ncbi:MAG: WYL domain-containing protein [Flavobacterium sp.]|nr:WYL domain-containing protein [Flavobacterium sp.]